jgi:hypothetical protein
LAVILVVDTLRTLFRSFVKALTFSRSNQYINTARIDPALLYIENSRLRVKDKKCLAVCIMTGTLTESYLIEPSETGPRNMPYSIHKVTIAPLEQEMRRDASVWGMLFDFQTITGSVSPAGLGFTTRGEGKGDGYASGKWKKSSRIVLIFFHSICPIFTRKVQDIRLEVCLVIDTIVGSGYFLLSFQVLQ